MLQMTLGRFLPELWPSMLAHRPVTSDSHLSQSDRNGDFWLWHGGMRQRLRRVFMSGIEGLTQPLAQEFADRWATRCGCRYGHGTDALRIALAGLLA
jgi:hypothetical protein